jgi:hypothetical protein
MKLYYIVILATAVFLVTACNNNAPSDPNTPRIVNERINERANTVATPKPITDERNEVEKAASEVKDAADEIKDAANSVNDAKDALGIPK